jgi:hypothetical protein
MLRELQHHQLQSPSALRLHAVAVGCASALYAVFQDPSLVLILDGTLMCVVYLILGLQESRRTALFLTPLSFYFFWYSIGLGLSAIWMGIRIAGGEPTAFSTVSVDPNDLATGYLIFLVGSLALHAGMQCFRPVREQDKAWQLADLPAGIISLVIMYVVGVAALFGGTVLSRTQLGSLAGILEWTALGALSCFALRSPADFDLSPVAFKTILVIGTTCLFVADLNSGSKQLIMYSFFPVFWFALLRPQSRRWLPLMLPLAVLLYSVVAEVSWISRNVELGEKEQPGSSVGQMKVAYNEWWSGANISPDASAAGQLDDFFVRLFDPVPLGFIVAQVHQSGFMMGETMSYAAYAFIPRLIWPDKPDVTRGVWFTFYLGSADSPESEASSTAQTATGELYWNFGILGVLVGMFVIGAFAGRLWRMAGSDPHQQPLRTVLYVLLMTRMNMNMAEAITVITGFTSMFVIFGTIFWCLRLFTTETHVSLEHNPVRLPIAASLSARGG